MSMQKGTQIYVRSSFSSLVSDVAEEVTSKTNIITII